jgi:hypothetical protein
VARIGRAQPIQAELAWIRYVAVAGGGETSPQANLLICANDSADGAIVISGLGQINQKRKRRLVRTQGGPT